MDFRHFVNSRVIMTKTQYVNTYGEAIDNEKLMKVYVYADGMHIEDNLDGTFYVTFDRSEYTGTLDDCEKILWDNFAKHELNPEPISTSLEMQASKPPIEKPSSASLEAIPRIKAFVVPSSTFFDIKSFSSTINGSSYLSENIVTLLLLF